MDLINSNDEIESTTVNYKGYDSETEKIAENEVNLIEPSVLIGETDSSVKENDEADIIKTKFDQQELRNMVIPSISDSVQKPSEGITTLGKKQVYPLDSQVTIEKGDLYYNGVQFGNINENTRQIYIDREKGLDQRGINSFLSHTGLAPYATYNINHGLNTTIYKTDGIGRCLSVENIAKERGNLRSENEQVRALRTKNEQTLPNTHPKINDQAGHYIASSNGGIPESINLFPQAYRVNNGSDFKNMERMSKSALKAGSTVKTSIDVNYKGLSFRPDSLKYKVQIDGGQILEYKFDNKNYTQKEISPS